MSTSSTMTPQSAAVIAAPAATRVSALVAALFGAFLVLAAGFAPIEAVYNALHDARHAAGFPCH